jgi:uncharacterized phiE125 gp8 family phage protein
MNYQIDMPTVSGMVVSLSEIKKHVAIDVSETYYDTMLTSMEAAAVGYIESKSRLTLLRRSGVIVYVNELPTDTDPLYIPIWPVNSLTSLSYVDTNGTSQSLTVQAELLSPPAALYPEVDEVWPDVQEDNRRAVTITINAGFVTVPEMVIHAIKMLVGHWFRNRETVLVGSISKELEKATDALMVQFRKNFFIPFGVYQ